MKLLLIDNYDSFTHNISEYLYSLKQNVKIVRNDKFNLNDVKKFNKVIISPGPGNPDESGKCLELVNRYYKSKAILGICLGHQIIGQSLGGKIIAAKKIMHGKMSKIIHNKKDLFKNMPSKIYGTRYHSLIIEKKSLPKCFEITAKTDDGIIMGIKHKYYKIYGIQFHPEVYHSIDGKKILFNFLINISKIKQSWTPSSFVESTIRELRSRIKDEKVILGLSGGVDSSVAAVILNKAIGENLYCVFIDNGLLRKNEFDSVLDQYKGMGLNVIGVDAKKRFYNELKDVSDPEQKRKAIGKIFIDVFDDEASKINDVKWLAQGTIYPDVIESISVKGPSATIKSHHNVGGLPDYMKLKVVEPLRMLFKDEVRNVGAELNISKNILMRHPFPGPGLAIRILGDVDENKVRILQDADDIFIGELKKHNLYSKIWQAGVMLLPVRSVGVMGDERTYENCVALRAVTSTDGMTADWYNLPYDFLQDVSNKIINNVKGINRVVYDISSKPPATIEWE